MSDVTFRAEPAPEPAPSAGERLSLGVAARLSRYLQVLTQARKMGKETISSQELSDYTHVNSTQIRRDLSGFGKFGKRGVGYNVDSLVSQIRKILRTSGQHNIALFGAGHLGTAIASSDIFADHGFRIVAVFDTDPAKVSVQAGPLPVRDVDDLGKVVDDEDIVVAALASRFEELRAAAAADPVLADSIAGELIASEIEIRSGRGDDFADAVARQRDRRRRLFSLAGAQGAALGATGTHPFSDYREQRIIDTEHYRRLDQELRYVVWRNDSWSVHAHVGVRGPDRAVAVGDRLRPAPPGV